MRIEYFTEHYGFVVDYLAEALRELRRHNFTEVIDRHFSLGSHLNARDVKAVRKTVSGLTKLLLIAVYAALKKHSALAALLILGYLSIQGNIKPVRSLAEPLQIGMDNGARRALIPLENKRNFLDVSADIMERVDPVFYGDPMTAALKALGMN
jgi:predicted ATP-dependent Lon-type protease